METVIRKRMRRDDNTPLAELGYASPHPFPRPPFYSIVLSLLAAMFLIVFGAALTFATTIGLAFLLTGDKTVKWWGVILFLPIGLLFLCAGVLTMVGVIQTLRGVSPGDARWERWARLLQVRWMIGR